MYVRKTLLPTPVRSRFRFRKLTLSAPWLRNFVNLLSAICCFAIVVVYLFGSAIPSYNEPQWDMVVDFAEELPLPAFAFIVWQYDAQGRRNSLNYTINSGATMKARISDGVTTHDYPAESLSFLDFTDNGASFRAYIAGNSHLNLNLTRPIDAAMGFTFNTTCTFLLSIQAYPSRIKITTNSQ